MIFHTIWWSVAAACFIAAALIGVFEDELTAQFMRHALTS